jgi:N-acetylmuramoyl-L-alanine amidase
LSFWQRSASAPLAAKSESLARFIQAALVERTRALNRGIKSEQFYVIANLRHPAALVEGGFMTNKSDVTKLTTTEYRQQIAMAICDGVQRHWEAARRDEPTVTLAAARPE